MQALIIICLIIFLIAVSKIRIKFTYKRDGENDIIVITIIYLKYLKYSYNISLIDIDNEEKGFGFRLVSSIIGNKKKDKHEQFLDMNKIRYYLNVFKRYFKNYRSIFRYLFRKTTIEKLETNIYFGLLDPAITGILTGILYAILGNIFVFLSTVFKIKSLKLNVNPNFNTTFLNIYFYCIFNIRIGNIIYVLLRFVIMFLHYKFIHKLEVKINSNMR